MQNGNSISTQHQFPISPSLFLMLFSPVFPNPYWIPTWIFHFFMKLNFIVKTHDDVKDNILQLYLGNSMTLSNFHLQQLEMPWGMIHKFWNLKSNYRSDILLRCHTVWSESLSTWMKKDYLCFFKSNSSLRFTLWAILCWWTKDRLFGIWCLTKIPGSMKISKHDNGK